MKRGKWIALISLLLLILLLGAFLAHPLVRFTASLYLERYERAESVYRSGIRKFYLHVHPYVAAYINQGMWSLKRQWQMKYGMGIRIIASQKLAFLQYEFYDKERQFIDMQEETDNNS